MANPKTAAWYGGAEAAACASAGALGSEVVRKTVTFDGTAGNGAVGTVALFSVTGPVLVRLVAICTESLVTGAGATISVGTPGSVSGLIAVTDGVDIDAGDIWFAAAPATVLDTEANSFLNYVIGDGADIQANILVDAVSDGTIVFNCFWTPLSATSTLVAA